MPIDTIRKFETLLKASEIVSRGIYQVSSAKRATLTPPQGTKVYDLGTDTWYIGDSSTTGGVAEDS